MEGKGHAIAGNAAQDAVRAGIPFWMNHFRAWALAGKRLLAVFRSHTVR